jgi:hypothetical protein
VPIPAGQASYLIATAARAPSVQKPFPVGSASFCHFARLDRSGDPRRKASSPSSFTEAGRSM